MTLPEELLPINLRAAARGLALPMWVVYDRPSDYPEAVVLRLWETLPEPTATEHAIPLEPERLAEMREALADAGYIKLLRTEEDDPAIMETWL